MKPTSKTISEELDTVLNDLLEQVNSMREMLLSAKTSLEKSESLNAKHQVQVTPSTYLVGRKRLEEKRKIIRKQGGSTVSKSSLQYLSRLEEGQ